jgi:hypothetical protein
VTTATKKNRPKRRAIRARKPDSAVEYTYALKVVTAQMTAYNRFQWPESGPVEAPDWNPAPECGGGLHGWLMGEGDVSASGSLHTDPAARWLVLRVEKSTIIDLGGKVKFPRCGVVFCGARDEATAEIRRLGATGAIIYGTSTSGYRGTSTSGYHGTSTSGDYGTSTSGYRGTSTSGDYGTSTSGDYGTSTSGDGGTSTSGDYGTSTSGDGGTSTSGYRGTSTSGDYGTSTSGDGGELRIRWHDGKRYRCAVFYVGEDGIEANVPYRVDGNGKPVRADGKEQPR